MDEDAAWYRSRPRPRPQYTRRVPVPAKGAQQPLPPLFSRCLLWPRSPISASAELLFKFWRNPTFKSANNEEWEPMHKHHNFLKSIAMSNQYISLFHKYLQGFLANKSMAKWTKESFDYHDHHNYNLVMLYLVRKLFSKLQHIKIYSCVYFNGFIAKNTKPQLKKGCKKS